jgi:hypothetical protein
MSHYIQHKSVKTNYVEAKDVNLKDDNGNYILDAYGNPALYHTMRLKSKIDYVNVIEMSIDDNGIEAPLTAYDILENNLKQIWIEADRENTVLAYKAEYDQRHKIKDRLPLKGTFNGIAKDIFYDNQPVYQILNFGIDGHTLKPYCKVKLNNTDTVLFIDVSKPLKDMSKNKKRKILRYACKGILDDNLDYCIFKAVKDYLSR